jgi:hypothetical protein
VSEGGGPGPRADVREAARAAVRFGDIARRALDALFAISAIALVAALVLLASVLPNARRAARAEAAVRRAEAEVAAVAARVEELRVEVQALCADPWYIELTLRRKAKALRPDLFPAAATPTAR